MIAVISDVHANLAALEAVLADIRRRAVQRIYCLGDTVGYSASPRETIALLRAADVVAIKGNHDMMATGELPVARCGPIARSVILWTRGLLSADEWSYLRGLPRHLRVEPDLLLLHSGLEDPLGYLIDDGDYRRQHAAILAHDPSVRICFTGHTHQPRLVEIGPDAIARLPRGEGAALDPSRFYFINPGSVGQPRRSDYRASYATFDPSLRQVMWHRVTYDRSRTLAANRRHGIRTDLGPGRLGYRLRAWMARWRDLPGTPE